MSSTNLITPSGYSKMILHASKHPTQPISGLLVGKIVEINNNNNNNNNKQSTSTLFISDVIPLTHTQVATLPHPIVEAGVRMVHSQACSQGCSVVGTYFANERFDDSELCEMNRRMAREVAKLCSQGTAKNSPNSSSTTASDVSSTKSGSGDVSSEVSSSKHITLLLDNVLLCSEEGPTSILAVSKLYNSLSGAKSSNASSSSSSSNLLQFSNWNRDNGVPDAPQTFDEVKAKLNTIVSGKQQALWDFEEHLENCTTRDFYNPWI